jgi:hypothetical protein
MNGVSYERPVLSSEDRYRPIKRVQMLGGEEWPD